MKIQYKLFIMVGLPICALIAISLIGFMNFKGVKTEIQVANKLHLDRATMINGDRDAYQAQRALEIAIDADNAEDLNTGKSDVITNIQQTWDRINEPAKDFPPEMQNQFNDFSNEFTKWKENNTKILSLSEAILSVNNARKNAFTEAYAIFGKMRDDVDKITDIVSEQLKDHYLGEARRLQLENAVILVLNGDRDAYQAYVGLLLVSRTKDQEELKKQAAVFFENAQQVKERVTEAADISGGDSLPLKKSFLEHYNTWEKAAKTVVDLSQSSFADNRAIENGTRESYSTFDSMRNVIDKLGEAEASRVENSIAGMNASIDQTVLIFIILSVVFILVSFVLAFFISQRISNGVNKSTSAAQQIAQGDFNIDLQSSGNDEIAALGNALNSMANTLKANNEEIQHKSALAEKEAAEALKASEQAQEAMKRAESAKSEGLRAAADKLESVVKNVTIFCNNLSEQSESIRSGSEIQADRIASTATAMEEMNATVLEVARNSSEAASLGENAKDNAQKGAAIVDDSLKAMTLTHHQTQELKKSMDALGLKTEEIGNIMNVIEDIADQTNLLALNAAIEAARAGEAGRGFAVVADEVRKLAEKTMNATKEVGESIRTIQGAAELNMQSVDKALESLNKAVKLSQESGTMLGDIVEVSVQTASQVLGIATAAEEQSATSEEISLAVAEINQVTTENMKYVHASTDSIRELSDQVEELNSLIEELKSA